MHADKIPEFIYMVGGFPPPVNGMVAVNAAIRDELLDGGATVRILDVAAKSVERSMFVRARRLKFVVGCLFRLIADRNAKRATMYMGVSGGAGKIYEAAFLVVARIRGMRIYLHHHSFAYIDRHSLVAAILCLAAGKHSTHVALSLRMAQRLRQQYRYIRRVTAVSNSGFLIKGNLPVPRIRDRVRTIGFLSNVSFEKGIKEFVELSAMMAGSEYQLNAIVAGPCQSDAVERFLTRGVDSVAQLEYVGAKYGEDREEFFDSIDVLVFPSRYVNEAEPLTIHEALQRAIPVIAYGRGAIPEIIPDDCGYAIEPDSSFVSESEARLVKWISDPRIFRDASESAAHQFNSTRELYSESWIELKRELLKRNYRTPKATLLRA